MEIRVLGPLEVTSDQGTAATLGGARQRAVLALLVAHAGEVRSVDQILDAVWADAMPANPKAAVQVAISRLRKELGAERVLSRGPGYVLRIEPDELDADEFERLVTEARHAVDADQHRLAIERFDHALSLWNGDPYADFSYADFAQAQILKLHTLRAGAIEDRFDARIAVGEHAEVLPEIEAQLALNPLREGIWASYMLALYRDGRQADALRAYRRAASTLGDELGIEPGPELRALEERMVMQSPDLDRAVPTAATELPEGEVALLVADAGVAAEHDPDGVDATLAILDEAVSHAGGHVFRATADQRFAVFAVAQAAVRCALAFGAAGIDRPPSLAIHVTEARVRRGEYVGLGVSRAARVGVVGLPGEVLVTEAAWDALRAGIEPPTSLLALDARILPGTSRAELLWRLMDPSLPEVAEGPGDLVGNLPATELSSFVGRAAELADVRELMDTARLITLTGPGGVGKTRLALQAASDQVGRHPGGVWMVELATLDEPSQVAPLLATTLGLDLDPDTDAAAAVIGRLRDLPALLFMDNCEHLIDEVADLSAAVLEASPATVVLATSRERLGLAGEAVYQVPRLPVPDVGVGSDPDEVLEFEAVQLFATRATDVVGGFEVDAANAVAIATLCRRLDGIPLAIELAAGRVNVLSPAEMIGRLDERFSLLTTSRRRNRRETLRETIEWSYSLLNDAERRLLAWLSIFQGAFRLEAVEAVCYAGRSEGRAFDVLASLVTKSLVTARAKPAGPTTYELLETIAAYGAEQLDVLGERTEARDLHGRYFTELVLVESGRLFGPDGPEALARVTERLADVRAALGWASESQRALSLRLLSEVNQVWLSAGLATEGMSWAERFLGAFGDETSVDLGRGLKTAGALALYSGESGLARTWLDRAVAIGEELDDQLGTAMALTNLAVLDSGDGDLEKAAETYVRALEVLPEDADPYLRTIAVGNVGVGLLDLARFDEALPHFRRQLEMAVDIESPLLEARVLANIGLCLAMAGELDESEMAMQRGLELATALDPITAAQTAAWLSCIELITGRTDDAATRCTMALTQSQEVYAPGVHLCLLIAMAIAEQRDDPETAVQLFGAAQAVGGPELGPVEGALLKPYYDRATSRVDRATEALELGQRLDLSSAVALATASLSA